MTFMICVNIIPLWSFEPSPFPVNFAQTSGWQKRVGERGLTSRQAAKAVGLTSGLAAKAVGLTSGSR